MEVPHLLQAVRPTPVTFGVLTLGRQRLGTTRRSQGRVHARAACAGRSDPVAPAERGDVGPSEGVPTTAAADVNHCQGGDEPDRECSSNVQVPSKAGETGNHGQGDGCRAFSLWIKTTAAWGSPSRSRGLFSPLPITTDRRHQNAERTGFLRMYSRPAISRSAVAPKMRMSPSGISQVNDCFRANNIPDPSRMDRFPHLPRNSIMWPSEENLTNLFEANSEVAPITATPSFAKLPRTPRVTWALIAWPGCATPRISASSPPSSRTFQSSSTPPTAEPIEGTLDRDLYRESRPRGVSAAIHSVPSWIGPAQRMRDTSSCG